MPAADGEVVWSWRRDPGATLARSIALTTGARKAASPGRARISRKTTRAGKAGMSRLYLSNPCAFFHYHRTRCCGCIQRPAFPAPSARERDNEIAKLGQIAPRD